MDDTADATKVEWHEWGTEPFEIAERAMFETDHILKTPAPRAIARGFGDSAVVIELQFWIADPTAARLWRARTAVVESVKGAFEDGGIDIPFPQRTLSPRASTDPTGAIARPTPEGGDGTREDG